MPACKDKRKTYANKLVDVTLLRPTTSDVTQLSGMGNVEVMLMRLDKWSIN